jgi:transposase
LESRRRKFFVLADLAANAQRKAQGKTPAFVSPVALAAVRRIDALFDIERDINGQPAVEGVSICTPVSPQLSKIASPRSCWRNPPN